MGKTYLAGVLQQVIPLLRRDAALLAERVQVRELPVLAERQDEEVVELLRLGRPLALDDARAGPGRLADVVRVLFLLRAARFRWIAGVLTPARHHGAGRRARTHLRRSKDLATLRLQ